jgi:hypothetical protein
MSQIAVAREIIDLAQLTGLPVGDFRHVLNGGKLPVLGGTAAFDYTPPDNTWYIVTAYSAHLIDIAVSTVDKFPVAVGYWVANGAPVTSPSAHFLKEENRQCLLVFKGGNPMGLHLSGIPAGLEAIQLAISGYLIPETNEPLAFNETLYENATFPTRLYIGDFSNGVPNNFDAKGNDFYATTRDVVQLFLASDSQSVANYEVWRSFEDANITPTSDFSTPFAFLIDVAVTPGVQPVRLFFDGVLYVIITSTQPAIEFDDDIGAWPVEGTFSYKIRPKYAGGLLGPFSNVVRQFYDPLIT